MWFTLGESPHTTHPAKGMENAHWIAVTVVVKTQSNMHTPYLSFFLAVQDSLISDIVCLSVSLFVGAN